MLKAFTLVAVLLFSLVPAGYADPLATELNTTDLTEALGSFSLVSFNAYAKWEHTGKAADKILILNGTATEGALDSDGREITWQSNGPQAFVLTFDGTNVTFSVTDGGAEYTVTGTPASTAMNSLVIGLRARSGNNFQSAITVSGLAVDGVSLDISTISLVSAAEGTSSDVRKFLLVTNVTSPFSMTGWIDMELNRNASGQHAPSMQIFAGISPLADSATTSATEVPEPGAYLMIGVGMLLIGLVLRFRHGGSVNPDPGKRIR